MPSFTPKIFHNIPDHGKFRVGIEALMEAVAPIGGVFAGDQLITFGRNLGFLEDQALVESFQRNMTSPVERSVIWRTHTVTWAAMQGMRLDGDFVEIACYRGATARVVYDYCRLADHPGRKYYLYDLVEHDPDMPHHDMPEHGTTLFDQVKARFADAPNVVLTQGYVPQSLERACPDKVAFMHLDLNNADAEIGALEVLFERMVPGAVLVLDDYGWQGYRAQKLAEDPWFAARGYRVLELPTGQGMVIKQA